MTRTCTERKGCPPSTALVSQPSSRAAVCGVCRGAPVSSAHFPGAEQVLRSSQNHCLPCCKARPQLLPCPFALPLSGFPGPGPSLPFRQICSHVSERYLLIRQFFLRNMPGARSCLSLGFCQGCALSPGPISSSLCDHQTPPSSGRSVPRTLPARISHPRSPS